MRTVPKCILVVTALLAVASGAVVPHPAVSEQSSAQVYTCSMHPQVRLPAAGSCPICGMPLVSASGETPGQPSPPGAPLIALSAESLRKASVETVPVEALMLSYEVKAVGKVEYNETALATITARVDGYAEHLYVNFTGVDVKQGDHLAEIYSPDLVVAQQELLVSSRGLSQDSLLESSVLKLKRWGLSDQQIRELRERRKVTERVTLYSPISGTVIARNVTQNGAFKAGDALYQIANLQTVWVYLEIYESQLPWLRYGQRVLLTTESRPGRTFEGTVTFMSPLVEERTRTVRVPVHIENRDHALKPGMFMTASIRATLASGGQPAATGVEGKFTCPMHPQVIREQGGTCPVCGMDLEEIPGATAPGMEKVLAVPVSAVLDGGNRKIVYVEVSPGRYQAREIVVGPKAGAYVAVLSGITEGERIAVRGNFLLDSQAQISGAPSLFYPRGPSGSEEQHHGDAPAAHHHGH